jgi:hypothetical protein
MQSIEHSEYSLVIFKVTNGTYNKKNRNFLNTPFKNVTFSFYILSTDYIFFLNLKFVGNTPDE